MGKRGQTQSAATDSKATKQAAQTTEAPEIQPGPATKKSRTTRKQQQQQPLQDAVEVQKDAQPAPAKAVTRRKPSTQQQAKSKKQDAEEELARPEVVKTKRRRTPKVAAAAVTAAAGEAKSAAEKPAYYLVKSEPEEFSIEDLEAKADQTEPWEGVRNAQARNIMRGMDVGDLAFFYHSSCKVPGIVGIAQVVRQAYPDPTAFDPKSKYYDANSSKDKPKWWMVDWKLVRKLKRQITLQELKIHKDASLEGMALFNRPRLSVQPVTQEQWEFILTLEEGED